MSNILVISGASLCLIALFIFSRKVFSPIQYDKGTAYLYSREETEKRALTAKKKAIRERRLDIFAIILNILGIICQIMALFV